MDLIYRRRNRDMTIDSGYLAHFKADFDVTTDTDNQTNDFEITMVLPTAYEDLLWVENEVDCIIFVEGTEWGGEIKGSVINIEENTITYTGRTWRGTLDQYIIEPPAGEDYKIVSGNLAPILRDLPMNPYIQVENTSYSTGTFQFDRYISTYDGVDDLLKNVNLDLRANYSFSESTLRCSMNVAMARDLRSLIEVSQDYNNKIKLRITRDGNTPKHLICLGKGELHEREVINLYADDNWNISQTPIIGAYPVDVYDISNTETLLADGFKKYTEIIGNHKQIDVTIDDLEVRLGDIIGARDHLTGEYVSAEISKIVWRVENFGTHQFEDFEYETKVRLRN